MTRRGPWIDHRPRTITSAGTCPHRGLNPGRLAGHRYAPRRRVRGRPAGGRRRPVRRPSEETLVAAEIIPIELGLTAGNGVTLWAPRWQEDGEEWEAFLGHGDDLYVLPSAAHLAAFIRTTTEHDLARPPRVGDRCRPARRRAAAGRGPQLRHRRRARPGRGAAGHLDARRAVGHGGDPALAGRGLRPGRDRRGARFGRRVRGAAARRAGVHRPGRREAVERAGRRRRRPVGRGAGRDRRHRHHPGGRTQTR